MQLCVIGAGAIGGYLAARLTAAGHRVSLLARGATLDALRADGLTLSQSGETLTVRPDCTDEAGRIGAVDAVLVAVKGPALVSVGEVIGPLLGAETPVVFAMNGIPWWYDHARPDLPDSASRLLDPDGVLEREIGADRAIGCVVDCPVRVERPGVVVCNSPDRGRFTLGEPDGSRSQRLAELSAVLESGSMDVPPADDIREAIWAKLIINLSRSPLAVLTGASERALAEHAGVSEIAKAMVDESVAVAAAHGFRLEVDPRVMFAPEFRFHHRPSMLQDWDAGRPMEIDSIGVAVARFARAAEIATPVIDRVLALLTLKARAAGLY